MDAWRPFIHRRDDTTPLPDDELAVLLGTPRHRARHPRAVGADANTRASRRNRHAAGDQRNQPYRVCELRRTCSRDPDKPELWICQQCPATPY